MDRVAVEASSHGRARAAIGAPTPWERDVVLAVTRNRRTLEHGLSNGLIESTNTKIRLLQPMALGFTSADALIALAMLSLGGFRPHLPGRTAT